MIMKQEIGKTGFGVRPYNSVSNNVTLWYNICVVRRAAVEISNVDLWEYWGYLQLWFPPSLLYSLINWPICHKNMPRKGSSLLVAIHSKCQWQQFLYVMKNCSKYDMPELDVSFPNAWYMHVMSFQNWLVQYRVYLGLSLLLKLTWNKTPKVSQQVSKW